MTTKQSAFVKSIAAMREAKIQRARRINAIIDKCSKLNESDLPPIEYINKIGSDTHEHFKSAMIGIFSELVNRFRLENNASVLDIGCGCGRLSYPFSMYLENGKYYGIDVWKDGINWCKENISNKYKNSYFHTIQSKNNYYFEKRDKNVKNSYSIDLIKAESVDLVFAISVFTHLVKDDCVSYFHEISRILKNNGAAYITCFIIDRHFFEYVKRTGNHTAVKEEEEGCYYAYEGQDFFAGYTNKTWRNMLDQAGLEIVSYEAGEWAEKPGSRIYQDTFVIIKKS